MSKAGVSEARKRDTETQEEWINQQLRFINGVLEDEIAWRCGELRALRAELAAVPPDATVEKGGDDA